MQIPVFIINGFLESGKTTFIKETLASDDFNDGSRSLVIACEDGEEEYYKNEFEEEGLIYLKAILERANISYRQEKMPLVHHARSKIKCYKKNLNRYIDK